jgi:hypothetical protein
MSGRVVEVSAGHRAQRSPRSAWVWWVRCGQWGGCNEATRTRMITRHLYLMFGCDFLSRAQSHVTSFSQSSGEACVISARGGGGKGEHGAR